MGKFKKGGWVEITTTRDFKWKNWSHKHDLMKGKVAEIERIEISQDDQKTFYYLRDMDGNGNWFLGHHIILTHKQDRRFINHMKISCEKLQDHERLCKKLRDDILEEVFVDERERLFQEEFWDNGEIDITDDPDEFEEDWENVKTEPMVALPVKKKKKKSKIRKSFNSRKKKGAKAAAKQNTNTNKGVSTSNLDPADWMTAEELEDYLESVYGIDWL
mgnify:CR=1 FL=1|jgi:hypothetical protein